MHCVAIRKACGQPTIDTDRAAGIRRLVLRRIPRKALARPCAAPTFLLHAAVGGAPVTEWRLHATAPQHRALPRKSGHVPRANHDATHHYTCTSHPA